MSQKKSHIPRINKNWTPTTSRTEKSYAYYLDGLAKMDRKILAESITYIESNSVDFQDKFALLEALPKNNDSVRIGISGSPGVGKSTFINALGIYLLDQGKKVAVLAVDPSSTITHGSILGDKTRMYDLTLAPHAFIRPTASSNTLGGVSHHTKEAILLCEAAGYDVILIETVGVGQSETELKNLVDIFTLLLLPGAGDELQGIKKGIVEISDLFIINKADGDRITLAKESKKHYQNALHLSANSRSKPIAICSALEQDNLDTVWTMMQDRMDDLRKEDQFTTNRASQNALWAKGKMKEIFSNRAEKYHTHFMEKGEESNVFKTLIDYDQSVTAFMDKMGETK